MRKNIGCYLNLAVLATNHLGKMTCFLPKQLLFFLKSGAKKTKAGFSLLVPRHILPQLLLSWHIFRKAAIIIVCVFQEQVATDVFNNSITSESQLQQHIQILIYIFKIHYLVIASVNQKPNLPFCYHKLPQPSLNLQATKEVLVLE